MRNLLVGALLLFVACGDNLAPNTLGVNGAQLVTPEDTPVTHSLDVHAAGGGVTVQAGAAGHGEVAIEGLQVTYTPAANYVGADSFTIKVSNGPEEATAAISIMVTPVNDTPLGNDDTFAATEDTP